MNAIERSRSTFNRALEAAMTDGFDVGFDTIDITFATRGKIIGLLSIGKSRA
jgi:hypothetical protein